MARDESLAPLDARLPPPEASHRLPLTVLLVLAAFVTLGVGGFVVLLEASADKEGDNLDEAGSPGVICQHLYNEIPINAKRFDPDLNDEYRTCVGREHVRKYTLLGAPFVLGAIGLLITAIWSSRRHSP